MPPSWEEVIAVMRDDKLRTFKVDIETDSTVAASVESDMAGLRDVLTALNQVMQGFGPAVQMGAMPVEALKEIMLTITRRAKMGNAVEDAFDKIKQPPPPPQEQQPQDNSLQVKQMELQHSQQVEQGKAQMQQAESQQNAQLEQAKMMHEAQMKQFEVQANQQMEQARIESENDLKWRIAQLQAETSVVVANINAAQKAQSDAMSANAAASAQAADAESKAQEKAEGDAKGADMQNTLAAAMQGFQAAIERLSHPRSVIRDVNGRIAGVQ
jgi:hypothetical protein